MAKSRQNKVPPEFGRFYVPILNLKQLLQSSRKILDVTENQAIIQGLMALHYSTFIMCALYKITDNGSIERALFIRKLVEDMLEENKFEIEELHTSRICSFTDAVARYLNTTTFAKLHIAMYQGYLDYEIYYQLHQELNIFDFKGCCTIAEDTVKQMKEFYNASLVILEQSNKSG